MRYTNRLLKIMLLLLVFSRVKAQDANTEKKINDLIAKMTLEEKVGMLHANSSFTSGGVPRLGIPELVTSDGPHGVRIEHGRDWDTSNDHVDDAGTYLPTGICLAATWSPKLGYEFGKVLGSEANARGKDVILGPGINIIRTPLNGRNFEYQSEDPFLISKMAVGYIKGVQDQGVSACVKHFIANNQETDRHFMDINMSDRALREIYLPGFKAAVTEAKVNTVMGAYNKFRGQWASQNHYLLNQILKGEWKFEGIVISDWGAINNTMEALYNGTDIEFGSEFLTPPKTKYSDFFLADTVVTLVKSGKVSEKVIDEKVRRILRVMFKTNMIDAKRQPGSFATPQHFNTALKVAEEGIVLLKNQNNFLPLNSKKIKTIAVIGVNAFRPNSMGGGSSQVKAKYEITPLEGIKNYLGKAAKVVYAPGYENVKDAKANPKLIADAVKTALSADVVIYVGGWNHGYGNQSWDERAYDAEALDKPDMNLPFGQDELIKAILKVKPQTVMVMMGGGAVDMTQWVDDAKTIVQAWYPGMEGGNALANILFGKVNPSGKLPVSFPKKLEDSPAHKLGNYPGFKRGMYYNEDIFVGYRYFDTYKVKPQFAFGHGLSYTTFEYKSKYAVIRTVEKTIGISFTITNTGKKAGYEVAQLYIKPPQSALPRPEKELKGFEKVWLEPGETKTVDILLHADDFKYYDDLQAKWVLEKGDYTICIGSSSDDIRLNKNINL